MIAKAQLSDVNKILKLMNLRVVLSQGSQNRYIIQRKRLREYNCSKVGSYFAVGLAYGDALLAVLGNPNALIAGNGDNGWYPAARDPNDSFGPVQLNEEQIAALEEILP